VYVHDLSCIYIPHPVLKVCRSAVEPAVDDSVDAPVDGRVNAAAYGRGVAAGCSGWSLIPHKGCNVAPFLGRPVSRRKYAHRFGCQSGVNPFMTVRHPGNGVRIGRLSVFPDTNLYGSRL
jgi:hypothetical protein